MKSPIFSKEKLLYFPQKSGIVPIFRKSPSSYISYCCEHTPCHRLQRVDGRRSGAGMLSSTFWERAILEMTSFILSQLYIYHPLIIHKSSISLPRKLNAYALNNWQSQKFLRVEDLCLTGTLYNFMGYFVVMKSDA